MTAIPSVAARRDVLLEAADSYVGAARPGLADQLAGIVTPTDPDRIVALFGALVVARSSQRKVTTPEDIALAADEVEWLLDELVEDAA